MPDSAGSARPTLIIAPRNPGSIKICDRYSGTLSLNEESNDKMNRLVQTVQMFLKMM